MQWQFVILILPLFVLAEAKNLWCYQGGAPVGHKPAQCASNVQECFKFECFGDEDGNGEFVTRGCGLPEQSNKSRSFADSCTQARQICSQFNNSKGRCSICVRDHMCNFGPSFNIQQSIFGCIVILFTRFLF